MDAWTILGLPETTDMDAVRQAYHKQIALHNPEDDAEGFIRVRSAYEAITAALTQAEHKQDKDDSPIARFMARVEAVYANFGTRIDPEAWTVLLADEVCMRLDMEEETNRQLVLFLMQHYHLPQDIWQLLGTHFDWPSGQDLLKRDFPANFIDFIINSMDNKNMDYALFESCSDDGRLMDHWICQFLELENAILSYEPKHDETIDQYVREITAMPVGHPYLTLLLVRLSLLRDHADEALTMITPLLTQHPTDTRVRYHHALVLGALERHEEAVPIFKALLDENPLNWGAKRGLIESAVALGDYENARALVLDVLDVYPNNALMLQIFHFLTDKLITFYEAEHAADPTNAVITMQLAKHYLNDYRFEACRTLVESLPDLEVDERTYEYLADCHANLENFEVALDYYRINISRVKKYRNNVKFIHVLLQTEQYNDVLTMTEEAFAVDDKDDVSKAFLYAYKGRALHALERYDEAIAAYDEGLRANANTMQLYIHKAITCRSLHRVAEAVDLCEQSIYIFPYHTEAYTLMMEIFYDADLYDRMVTLANQAVENGHHSPRVQYFKACALRMMGEVDEAEAILNELLADSFDEGYRDHFYSELAYICLSRIDYAGALRNMEEAIRLDDEPVYRQFFIANVHRMRGAFNDALALYNELIAAYPRMIGVWMGRGDTYADMRAFEHARSDFDRVLAIFPNYEPAYDRIIDAYFAEHRHAEAVPTAEQEIVLFPSEENYLRLAWLYGKIERANDADALYQKMLTMFPESERVCRSYGYHKKKMHAYDEAIALFNQSLEKVDNQPLLYAEIGYCLAALRREDEALATVNKGLSLFPDTGDLLMRRAMIYKKMFNLQGMLDDMLAGVAQVEQLEDRWNLPAVYTIIGDLYETICNDVENASKYYRKAIEADDEYVLPRINLGELYSTCCRRHSEALAICHEAVALAADDPEVYVVRARVYNQMKRWWAARRDYRKALALYRADSHQNDAAMLDKMAACYEGLHQTREAIDCYERALTAAAEGDLRDKRRLAENLYRRGQIEALRKEPNRALGYYNKAIKMLDAARFHAAKAALVAQRS